MSDVHDILELNRPSQHEISKAAILGLNKPGNVVVKKNHMKKPEGMHRELFALLYSSDGNKELPPLLQTDTNAQQGYKNTKARLGMRRVRPWVWVQFCNPARKDGALLWHWRRQADQGKDYPFAQFDKHVNILQYTDAEYRQLLTSETWSRAHTDSLMDLCVMFDLRWPVINDRWPHHNTDTQAGEGDTKKRTIEELKERYYQVTNALKKARGLHGAEGKQVHYDAEHEKRRKAQLSKLLERTPQQVEEEASLLAELRRIEARKKERERKTQDLQKLISGCEGAGEPTSARKTPKTQQKGRKSNQVAKQVKVDAAAASSSSSAGIVSEGIKFPELRGSGVSLRSACLKLPVTLGQKRVKAVETLLNELHIDQHPMPVEPVCASFNSLRADMVSLYELRTLLHNYVYELETIKLQHPGGPEALQIPVSLVGSGDDLSKPRAISDVLDTVTLPNTPIRKRKAAMEQSNILKKMKARSAQS